MENGTVVFKSGIFSKSRFEVCMFDSDQDEMFVISDGLQLFVSKVGNDGEYKGVVYPEVDGEVMENYPVCEMKGILINSKRYDDILSSALS